MCVQVRYQQELERQLEEQEAKKQQAYEEFLKEKLMIDEIVRKIYEEDQRLVPLFSNSSMSPVCAFHTVFSFH